MKDMLAELSIKLQGTGLTTVLATRLSEIDVLTLRLCYLKGPRSDLLQ